MLLSLLDAFVSQMVLGQGHVEGHDTILDF